jgi:hypothetical protein
MTYRTCLVCDKELLADNCGDLSDSCKVSAPPDDAIYFESRGNWGSTIFDMGEFNRDRLEIYVCDECLKKKARQIHYLKDKQETFDLTLREYLDR